MKKTFQTYAIILAAIFLFFSAIDRSEYGIEKRFWRVQKIFDQLAQDPKIVPEAQFDSLIHRYQNLLKSYPKSSLAPLMQMQIGRVYALKKDLAGAQKAFGMVPKLFPRNEQACSLSLWAIGKIYEDEKNTDSALRTYRFILQKYPLTEIGLNMPVYIANYYFRQNNNVQAELSLKEAEQFYQKVILDHPKSVIEFSSLQILAATYMAQEKWTEALKTLSRLFLDYGTSPALRGRQVFPILRAINTISVAKLRNVDQPILIYQEFIEKNPKHPLNKILKEMIGALQKMKLEQQAHTKLPR